MSTEIIYDVGTQCENSLQVSNAAHTSFHSVKLEHSAAGTTGETHLTGKHSPGESKGVKLRKLTLIHKYLILHWLQIFTPKMRLQPS